MRDADGYSVLHYPGDVSEGSPTARAGQLLGADEFGRPYEIIECETILALRSDEVVETHVFLQYATPETLRRAREVLAAVEDDITVDVRARTFWQAQR